MGRRFIELVPSPEIRAPLVRRALGALREHRPASPRRFGAFLGFSLFAHLALFGILLVTAEAPVISPADAYRANARAFSRALSQMGQAPGQVQLALEGSPTRERKDLEADIGRLFHFAKDISEPDKVRFFRSILEAGGILDAGGRVDTEVGAFYIAQAASGDAYEVDMIDRSVLDRIARMAADGAAEARAAESAGAVRAETGPADAPREYVTRDCPYAEILARGPRLFTIFDGFPDLGEEEDRPLPSAGDRSGARPGEGGFPRFPTGVILLSARPALAARPVPVLSLSSAERGRILDELIELGEDDQLETFKTRYLDVYDPDGGDMAVLTREFFYSNLNGVFIVTDPVTAAFDAVEGIHLRRAVYETYARYGRLLRRTRTGAALLLNLASAYDFERRTLEALAEAGREARWVMATTTAPSWQHQPRLKAYVVERLCSAVTELAARMGLTVGELSSMYLRRQEEIYRRLTGFGGDVMNRALFDWGRLDWALGRHAEAVAKWDRADKTGALSPRAFRSILAIMDRYEVVGSPKALADIERILLSNEALDKQDLLARHLKYGTWAKRAF